MLDTLALLMQCRFTVDQLLSLSQTFELPYSHKTNLQRDMLKLYRTGLVNRDEWLKKGAGQNEYYYFLKPAALEHLYDPDTVAELKKVEALFTPVGTAYQYHQLGLMANLLVQLEVSLFMLGGKVVHFTRENFFYIKTRERTIKPDGTVIIRMPDESHYLFFLECETAANRINTVKYKTGVFRNKIEAYDAYRKSKGFTKVFSDYPLSGFRVLVVSDSEKKVNNRLKLAAKMKKDKLFQFATIDTVLTAQNLFTEPIWRSPAGRQVLLD